MEISIFDPIIVLKAFITSIPLVITAAIGRISLTFSADETEVQRDLVTSPTSYS